MTAQNPTPDLDLRTLPASRWRKARASSDTGGQCIELAALSAVEWRKATASGDTGGQCVELAAVSAADWRKATASTDTGGECVELAGLSGAVAVRDSKDLSGPVLAFPRETFAAFLDTLR